MVIAFAYGTYLDRWVGTGIWLGQPRDVAKKTDVFIGHDGKILKIRQKWTIQDSPNPTGAAKNHGFDRRRRKFFDSTHYAFAFIIPGMFLFKKWRRKKIAARVFPTGWLSIIEANVSIYRRLPMADKEELRRHILIFLDEKSFVGCGGLAITDEIRVTIAAQACVLLLHRQTDYYPGLHSILVYPAAYIAKETRHLPGGIVEEGFDVREGESWHHGSVVLFVG